MTPETTCHLDAGKVVGETLFVQVSYPLVGFDVAFGTRPLGAVEVLFGGDQGRHRGAPRPNFGLARDSEWLTQHVGEDLAPLPGLGAAAADRHLSLQPRGLQTVPGGVGNSLTHRAHYVFARRAEVHAGRLSAGEGVYKGRSLARRREEWKCRYAPRPGWAPGQDLFEIGMPRTEQGEDPVERSGAHHGGHGSQPSVRLQGAQRLASRLVITGLGPVREHLAGQRGAEDDHAFPELGYTGADGRGRKVERPVVDRGAFRESGRLRPSRVQGTHGSRRGVYRGEQVLVVFEAAEPKQLGIVAASPEVQDRP